MGASTHQPEISLFLLHSQPPQYRSILVLRQVHRRLLRPVRASTEVDLINEPDQAKGFVQDSKGRIVVTILRKLMRRTYRVLAEENAVRQFHFFPFPPTIVAALRRGKEAPHLDDLSTTLLDLTREEGQQFAERGIREGAG